MDQFSYAPRHLPLEVHGCLKSSSSYPHNYLFSKLRKNQRRINPGESRGRGIDRVPSVLDHRHFLADVEVT